MSERSQLDLTQTFTRGNDLLVYRFDVASNLQKVKSDILQAFVKGFNCFRFEFQFKDRKFEDRFALPHAAGFDERDALELAEHAHARFLNTVSKLIA